ncbi:hypothetical protein [Curtobacterium sp. RRHDQ10]|uniref:hypothetical protein n=1 Tax=Curtobacterium phyllosphaerae TaxID=3413379 RepID=UPI003BF2B93A
MGSSRMDVHVDIGGGDVRDLVWGTPLPSVYVRQWVTFGVFAIVFVALLLRMPMASPLERWLGAPLVLVAALFTVLSLFIVRGTAAIRRREGLKKLGASLVEHGILRLDEVQAMRTTTVLSRTGPESITWTASAALERDGQPLRVVVHGGATDEARVVLAPER